MATATFAPRLPGRINAPRTPELRPSFRAGDVIGFSGANWESDLINLATLGIPRISISHVAIVGPYRGELVLFESTTLGDLPCIVRGEVFHGTQAHRIEDRLESYHGKAWHYPLAKPLRFSEADHLGHWLIHHVGIAYDEIGAFRSGGESFGWLES